MELRDRRDNLEQKIKIWKERERIVASNVERYEQQLSEEKEELERIRLGLEIASDRFQELNEAIGNLPVQD